MRMLLTDVGVLFFGLCLLRVYTVVGLGCENSEKRIGRLFTVGTGSWKVARELMHI